MRSTCSDRNWREFFCLASLFHKLLINNNADDESSPLACESKGILSRLACGKQVVTIPHMRMYRILAILGAIVNNLYSISLFDWWVGSLLHSGAVFLDNDQQLASSSRGYDRNACCCCHCRIQGDFFVQFLCKLNLQETQRSWLIKQRIQLTSGKLYHVVTTCFTSLFNKRFHIFPSKSSNPGL